jgi:hypothetical protein
MVRRACDGIGLNGGSLSSLARHQPPDRPLGLVTGKPENPLMPIVSRYIAANGRPVTKLLTPSGVTAYVADEIPLKALDAWYFKLCEELGVEPGAEPDQRASTLSDEKRSSKPR